MRGSDTRRERLVPTPGGSGATPGGSRLGRAVALAAVVAGGLGLTGCFEAPPVVAKQISADGVGMQTLESTERLDANVEANRLPEPLPPAPSTGPLAKDIYQNRSAKHIDPAALMRAGLLQALWIEANKSKSMARLSLEYERQLAANKDDARGDYRRMMDAAE